MRTVERFLRSEHAGALGPSDRAVLRELVNAAGQRDARYRDRRFVAATYIGVDALAERAGVSKATVKRALLRLVEAGLIARSPNYRLNTVTVIELPWVPPKPRPTPTPPLALVPGPAADEPRGGSPCAPTGLNMIPLGAQNEPAHLSEYICLSTSAAVASTTATETPRAAGANGGGVAAAAAAVSTLEGEPTADPRLTLIRDALLVAGIVGPNLDRLAQRLHAAGGTAADVERVRRDHAKRQNAGTGLLVRMLEGELERIPAIRQRDAAARAARDAAGAGQTPQAPTPTAWERSVARVDALARAQREAREAADATSTATPTPPPVLVPGPAAEHATPAGERGIPNIPPASPLAAALGRTSSARRKELRDRFALLVRQGAATPAGYADWLAAELEVSSAWSVWNKRQQQTGSTVTANTAQATDDRKRELERIVAGVARGVIP